MSNDNSVVDDGENNITTTRTITAAITTTKNQIDNIKKCINYLPNDSKINITKTPPLFFFALLTW